MLDFEDFWNIYIKNGFFVAVVLIIIGLMLGSLEYSGDREEKLFEFNTYQALQFNNKVTDEDSIEAAKLIKQILDPKSTSSEELKNIAKLRLISSSYLDLLFDKQSNLIDIVNGKVSDVSELVMVPTWNTFFILFGLISWGLISLGTTINMVKEVLESSSSLFDFPWKKPWVYIAIILMFPALSICMLIEGLYRLVNLIVLSMITLIKPKKIPEPSNNNQTSSTEKLKTPIESASKTIKKLGKRVSKTRELFLDTCIKSIDGKISKLKNQVERNRKSLVDAGEKLKEAQATYTRSKNKLDEWLTDFEKTKERTVNEFLADFDMILKLPHVAAVDFYEGDLKVYTDMVRIDYERKRYEIGIMRITLDLLDGTIEEIENLCSTHPKNYVHPYAANSDFCFGSLDGAITKALTEMQFASAVHLILRAIYSLDGDDTKILEGWKVIRK